MKNKCRALQKIPHCAANGGRAQAPIPLLKSLLQFNLANLSVTGLKLAVARSHLSVAGFNLPDGKSHLPVARLGLQIAGRPLPDAGRHLSVGLFHLPVDLSLRAVDF